MFHHQQGEKSDKSNKALQKQQQTTHTTAPQVNGTHPATLIQRAKLNPSSLNTDDVLRLQQTIGNRAATQLIAGKSGQRVQPKLTIGEPGDKYEQEADRVAAKVVQQINAPTSPQASQSESVQRQEMEDEELKMKPMVQRQPDGGMAATPDLEASINQARGSGQPLADNIREPIEQAFGADFSGVKVHTDAKSDQLNQSIQARAFTTGQDIFFRLGEYNPGSRGGQELLTHELTHVVQQNGSAVLREKEEKALKPISVSSQIVQTSALIQRVGENSIPDGFEPVEPPEGRGFKQVFARRRYNPVPMDIPGTHYDYILPNQQHINPDIVQQKLDQWGVSGPSGTPVVPVMIDRNSGKLMIAGDAHHTFVACLKAGFPVQLDLNKTVFATTARDWTWCTYSKFELNPAGKRGTKYAKLDEEKK
jgi:Domain of unknown function (DUF4157)